jgi:transcriptional regulator with XRE-family HTH domain
VAKDHPIPRAIGPVLRQFREDADLTQEKLALEAGVDRTFIGMIERGERRLTMNTVALILDALGVSWTELGEGLDKAQRSRKRK